MPENEMWKPSSSAARAVSQVSVKQCMTPPTRFRAFLAHDAQRVFGRRARMDDERLAAGFRRADVRAKALALPLEIAFEPVVVEPGLADRDDLRVRRELDERLRRDHGMLGIVGMRADGGVEIGVTLRERPHLREILERDRDAQRVRDAVLRHVRERARDICRELRKIEMTVRIDERRHAAAAGGCTQSR